jgi:hypothetical protein
MHSISTSTFFGSVLTATQLLAGLGVPNACKINAKKPAGIDLFIDFIHIREILHIGEEDIYFHHGFDARASSLQNRGQIRETLFLQLTLVPGPRQNYSMNFDITLD